MDLASILEARRGEIYEEYLEKTANSDVLEKLKGYYNKAVDSTERNIIRPVADKLRGISSDGFSAAQRSSLRSHQGSLARRRPPARVTNTTNMSMPPGAPENLQSSVANESARAEREWAQQSNRNIATAQKGMHDKANTGRRTVQIKSPVPKGRTGNPAPVKKVPAGYSSSTRDTQKLLMDSGYSLPRFGADGRMGPETRKALSEFDRDTGSMRGLPERYQPRSKKNEQRPLPTTIKEPRIKLAPKPRHAYVPPARFNSGPNRLF